MPYHTRFGLLTQGMALKSSFEETILCIQKNMEKQTAGAALLWRHAVALNSRLALSSHTPHYDNLVYDIPMSRTNIELDDAMVRKARKLTRLKTKRAIVNKALELLVRSESRKGVLQFYGSGIWKGDLKRARRNRP